MADVTELNVWLSHVVDETREIEVCLRDQIIVVCELIALIMTVSQSTYVTWYKGDVTESRCPEIHRRLLHQYSEVALDKPMIDHRLWCYKALSKAWQWNIYEWKPHTSSVIEEVCRNTC